MSLSGALSSAISALNAQSASLAMISDNIANSQTTGYKTNTAMFEDLVTGSSSAASYSSGGVTSGTRANITQQGLLTTTTNPTDVGIQGNGFFPVTTSLTGGTQLYTRDGAFTPDSNGYLVNNGSYLLGERTDASGNVVDNSLEPINTKIAPTNGSATTETTFALNLPADAAGGATFTSSMSVYDSLGDANTVAVTWTKSTTADNTWTASFLSAPTLASDSSVTTGGVPTGGPFAITFNSDGSLATPTAAPTISIPWTNGATVPDNITLNLGTAGKTDGLTQLASGATTPAIDVTSITSDGVARGQLSSVAVGSNGTVNATYSNGQTIAIYKIPVALFAAPDALQAQSDGLYSATLASGAASLQLSGQNGAGTIFGSELESSTTDTNTEFSSMISAQQAYSAASQVITAVDKMFDTLISSMR
jgi:flagellar hook protein FlgE